MIDKSLIGAIERSLERNEPIAFLKQSLLNSGYSHQDIDEAFKLVDFRRQHASERVMSNIQEKPIQQSDKPKFKLSLNKTAILISVLSLSLIIFIIFFLIIIDDFRSCRTFNINDLERTILGLSVNCNQVAIIFAESIVAMVTIVALIAVVIYLSLRKKEI